MVGECVALVDRVANDRRRCHPQVRECVGIHITKDAGYEVGCIHVSVDSVGS